MCACVFVYVCENGNIPANPDIVMTKRAVGTLQKNSSVQNNLVWTTHSLFQFCLIHLQRELDSTPLCCLKELLLRLSAAKRGSQ